MAQDKKNSNPVKDSKNAGKGAEAADVLYQRIGNKWYAFSIIEDEVFYGSLSPEEIEHLRQEHPVKEAK